MSPMEAGTRDLVVSVVQEHAEDLLRIARRYTTCAADAEDAYQRALEIFVKNAHRLDPGSAHKWLYVVVRHEALAVRRSRLSLVGVDDEAALDALDDGRHLASVEERSERADEMARAAEALQRLKPQEVTALWLKAEGLTYDEIADRQGWTYTKVNRCITEGRRAFLQRYAGIEAGEECERWSGVLSAIADGEVTQQQLLAARPHLRNCPSCRASLAAMQRSGEAVAALLPVAALPAATEAATPRLAELATTLHERAASAAVTFHERAATVAVKAQAAADAVLSGKAAAVAASAAAIAGGGVAVEKQMSHDRDRAQRREATAEPAATRTATAPDPAPAPPGAGGAAGPAPANPAPPRPADVPPARRQTAPAPPPEAIFAPEAGAGRPPPTEPGARAAGGGTTSGIFGRPGEGAGGGGRGAAKDGAEFGILGP